MLSNFQFSEGYSDFLVIPILFQGRRLFSFAAIIATKFLESIADKRPGSVRRVRTSANVTVVSLMNAPGTAHPDKQKRGYFSLAFILLSSDRRLFCKSEFLHKSLWLRIVSAEVAVDHSCILYAAFLKNLLTECVCNLCVEDAFLLEE